MYEICPVAASRFVATILAPIITIFSIIAFIYIAKFKGWLITISALFILIFGTIINIELFAFLLVTAEIILESIFTFKMGPGILLVIFAFIYYFSLICFIAALYGILGYACRKWRIKNNIPFNSVYEKDTTIMAIVFLVGSMLSVGPILYRVLFG